MPLDLQTAKANLAKAKEDAQFWENAIRLLSDPRIAGTVVEPRVQSATYVIATAPHHGTTVPTVRPYGELKRKVLETLPPWGDPAVSTSKLVDLMAQAGYVFASKTPAISVNEALVTLESEGLAFMVAKHGITRFWTKAQPERQTAPEGAA